MLDRISRKFFLKATQGQAIGKNDQNTISVRCPICGDSRKNKNLKRLHLYSKDSLDQDLVNCFNGDCPCQNKTMYSFLRDFFPALLPQYKKETFGVTLEKLASGETEDAFKVFKKEKITEDIIHHDLSEYLMPIEDSPAALEYVKSRGLSYDESRYGKWFYGFQDLKIGETIYAITNSIVIPLYHEGVMYGFYSRSLSGKQFYTYMHDDNAGFKVWNWFNINKDEPVYIYEGIFDAIAGGLPNSIALISAKLPSDRLKELKTPIFVLDNDKTGLLNSIEYANLGCQVFVQPNGYCKDMNENLLNGVDTAGLILKNIHSGISAIVRIKSKL